MSIHRRNNLHLKGTGDRAMVFAHGLGCNQDMWRFVAPHFETEFVTVLMDNAGAATTEAEFYDSDTHRSLHGYADDVVEIGRALRFENAIFVGHSCSAMIGALAAVKAPHMFESLILIAASPRYLDDGTYNGGYSESAVQGTVDAIRDHYSDWVAQMAPIFMQNADRPALAEELQRSFRNTDPRIAAEFAQAIFRSDVRAEIEQVRSRSLILQCANDPMVPSQVGDYLHQHLPGSRLEVLPADGHFPQLSTPDLVVAAIRHFVSVESHDEPGKNRKPRRRVRREPHYDRASIEKLLLQRAGELCRNLGRYDMYARAAGSLMKAGNHDADVVLTIRTRGADSILRMQRSRMPAHLIDEFSDINDEVLDVLRRREIAAINSAAIGTQEDGRGETSLVVDPRDWYDFENSSDDQLVQSIEAMEKDIIKVASLYVRLAQCAQKIRHSARLH